MQIIVYLKSRKKGDQAKSYVPEYKSLIENRV